VDRPLAPSLVLPRLRGSFGRSYRYVDRCDSTQDLLPPDAPEGAVAVAEQQQQGRGRLGRRWYAPAGSSILCSVCLRPGVDPARLPAVTLLAADAVVEAIGSETALTAVVKPPNDVLVHGRKVAGVLAEGTTDRLILGYGVNVNQLPTELPRRPLLAASSLRIELGREVDRLGLLVALLDALERRYRRWCAAPA
jgi:BirA family biotin operon repressor/biotin-[acetyl-CoA-carboxylase] ligase